MLPLAARAVLVILDHCFRVTVHFFILLIRVSASLLMYAASFTSQIVAQRPFQDIATTTLMHRWYPDDWHVPSGTCHLYSNTCTRGIYGQLKTMSNMWIAQNGLSLTNCKVLYYVESEIHYRMKQSSRSCLWVPADATGYSQRKAIFIFDQASDELKDRSELLSVPQGNQPSLSTPLQRR